MGFNPISPFNGQLKNGLLNELKIVKCEQAFSGRRPHTSYHPLSVRSDSLPKAVTMCQNEVS